MKETFKIEIDIEQDGAEDISKGDTVIIDKAELLVKEIGTIDGENKYIKLEDNTELCFAYNNKTEDDICGKWNIWE